METNQENAQNSTIEAPVKNTGGENEIYKKTLVDEAREAAKELREQNDRKEKLLKKEADLLERKEALKELGGDSIAGNSKREETPEEYKNRILKGQI